MGTARYLVLLGIAAGIEREVSLGDVVFGDPIIAYEYAKVEEHTYRNSPRPFRPPETPVAAFVQAVPIFRLASEGTEHSIKVVLGRVASGSKLVAARINSDTRGRRSAVSDEIYIPKRFPLLTDFPWSFR